MNVDPIIRTPVTFALLIMLFTACRKEECISCIAESPSGTIMDQQIGCSADKGYSDGFEDGFLQRFREQGDSARVNCARYRSR
jgi:hypothetical protein